MGLFQQASSNRKYINKRVSSLNKKIAAISVTVGVLTSIAGGAILIDRQNPDTPEVTIVGNTQVEGNLAVLQGKKIILDHDNGGDTYWQKGDDGILRLVDDGEVVVEIKSK